MASERTYLALFLLVGIIGLSVWFSRRMPEEKLNDCLLVGTNAEYPPFEYIENDMIVGFDIDLMQQIAQRLGKKMKLSDMPFSTLMAQQQMGNIQVIAAGLTPTEERARQVLFSQNYLEGDPLLVVSLRTNPKINSLEDLKGKSVIVNDGFSADIYMSKHKDIELKRFPTVADAFMALRANKADAYVTAQNSLRPFLEKNAADEFSVFEIDGTNEAAALAISKKHPELVNKINKALQQMKEEGALDALKKKWKVS
jgi:polar amino acid transport system substrate-binding protein